MTAIEARQLKKARRACRMLGWALVYLTVCVFGLLGALAGKPFRPAPCTIMPSRMEMPGFAPPRPVTASRAAWPQRYVVGQRVWRV